MSADISIDTGRTRTLAALEGLKNAWSAGHRSSARGRRQDERGRHMTRRRRDDHAARCGSLLTVCVMMATIMQALDTTIANVALPYMQGSLSTTQDQVNWVLTSYIVAAAIMTSPLGWMATRFGRKKLFIVCAAGFTVASMLCGVAQIDRADGRLPAAAGGVRRGAGAAVSQAVMLDIYPPEQARLGDGDLGHGRDARADHGSDARRLADRLLFLALGVLRQSAVRHPDRRRTLASSCARRPTRRDVPFSWFGFLTPVARHRRAADDARSRRGQRLVQFAPRSSSRRSFPSSASISFSPTASPRSGRSFRCGFSATGISRSRLIFMFLIGIILLATMALVTPYHPEHDGLSGAGERLSARHARHRHVRRDDAGRPAAQRQGRRAPAHLHRPRAGDVVALADDRLVAG